MRLLKSATMLSAGWLALPIASANAQTGCTLSGTTCTFPAVSNEPLVVAYTGASGSQSTPGGNAENYSYNVQSDLSINLPFNSAFQGIYVRQTGGDGSFSGPSSGGAGGDITLSVPHTITVNLPTSVSISDAAAGIMLLSQGGPGTDNNENQDSNGAPGGDAGDILIAPGDNPLNVIVTVGAADVGNTDNDIVGIELWSVGGNGGRLNESPLAQATEGGAGGDGGTINFSVSSITVGTAAAPIAADSVVGFRARSFGGRGPNDYNSHDDETEGGGGFSDGGDGGSVTIESFGTVSVTGRTNGFGGTFGMFAQSAGGDGGWAYNVGISPIVENGGPGGSGGSVTVNVYGDVTVTDTGTTAAPAGSAAIFANSIGGAGGVGQSQKKGGGGGNGGSVTVTVDDIDGEVTGTGINVDAILARSQGGQGGAGLENANNSNGGDGGNGGTVTVDIETVDLIAAQSSPAGQNSGRGIVAQSLSALGGVGSNGNEFGGNPGDGGSGGDGGSVTVTLSGGTLTTDGTNDLGSGLNYAYGILAQSVGGGGGDGGDFSNFLRGDGGSGGTGGNGGAVTVTNGGTIRTSGAQAHGIHAQSIGGGGGAGGSASGLVLALGGSGGSGGTSGTVTITNTGTIETTGYSASGILAQSIVGGGGSAGVSDGALSIGSTGGSDSGTTAGTVAIANTGTITTTGDAATAIVAQSIAGGGGSAAGGADSGDSSVGVLAIGANGGGGGAGGQVNVTDIGTLSTAGDFAHGLLAQSVGGGGGNGGDAFGIGVLSIPGGAIGGQSGSGGNGGAVTVGNTGDVDVTTSGTSSAGLLLQSIGGGGGNGGNATTAGVLTTFQFAMGGLADGAGAGGSVTATLSGASVETQGNLSAGIIAQSIGGGGGSGGSGTSQAASFLNIGLSLGGFGSGGGNGGTVSVVLDNGTRVATATGLDTADANDAVGVLVQSIGGGGGNGGAAVAKAVTTGVPIDPDDPDFTVTLNAQFAFGGLSGAGGAGGTASATLSGGSSVTTNGAGSHGILVQSIGGGGGSGGDASTATTVVPDSTQTYGLTINGALGGAGGNGGTGGAASATIGSSSPSSTASTVSTTGAYANAVVVQSIGGGGGNSGIASSQTNSVLNPTTVGLTFDLGAANIFESSAGAAGGTATLTLQADSVLQTTGDGARGAVVQSIGGGGGTVQGGEIQLAIDASGGGGEEDEEDDDDSSFTGNVTVGLGMKSGAGGDGDAVTVTTVSGSVIQTAGIDADGILAQSIGGGGGLAGTLGSAPDDDDSDDDDVNGSDDDDDDDDTSVSLNVTVGGRGGVGGDSLGATLTYASRVTTVGDFADGVVVQAIGGGGGTGGTAYSSSTGDTGQIDIGVGGSGGAAGVGGAITATFNDDSPGASVTTSGFMAHGVLLQSIGGGGGQGGDGSTSAEGSLTIGSAVAGSGGSGNNGNTVTVPEGGSYLLLTTNGADAHAFVAQSIGGGGGIGGVGNAAAADDSDGHAINIVVGGQGGTGGSGSAVSLTLGMNTNTYGNRAFGVVAQSIGGGGGIGTSGSADNLASVTVGGTGGTGGNGGAVTVDLTSGYIETRGAGAHGIIAQSIGGGGGIGGDISVGPVTISPAILSGANGSGGTVDVTTNATITTLGASAHGIIAQSIGGGGGLVGSSAGVTAGSTSGVVGSSVSSGDVNVTNNATISAAGENSIGIFAQSMGGANSGSSLGTVTVVAAAKVTGGSDGGAGIYVAGGTDNTVTVNAGVTVASAGTAIKYTSGNTTVTEASPTSAVLRAAPSQTTDVLIAGTVVGDILLENAAGNRAGIVTTRRRGTLVTGDLVGADLVNAGTVILDGDGSAFSQAAVPAAAVPSYGVTTVTGDFTQTATGVLTIGADFEGGTSDRLEVLGDAALDGRLALETATLVRDSELSVLSVAGTITGSLDPNSPAVIYETRIVGGELRVTAAETRFGSAFRSLSDNERAAGSHLDDIFDNGSGAYAAFLGDLNTLALNDPDGGSYAAALSALTPGASQAMAAASVTLMKGRMDGAMRCPVIPAPGQETDEDTCIWAEGGGAWSDQDGPAGYDSTLWGFGTGGQTNISENWIVGGAVGYERTEFDASDDRSSASGDTGYIAASVGREFGAFTLSGALAASYGSFETRRQVSVPGFSGTADGDTDVVSLGARARAAYTVGTEAGYIRPSVDLDVVYTHASGYNETGAGIFNLDVDDSNETAFVATPAIEVGGSMALSGGWRAGGYVSAGLSLSTEDEWETEATLAAAPSGTGTFETTLPIADVIARVGVGVLIANDKDFEAKLEYNGALGDDYSSHGGLFRLSKRF
jgi:uncharacterized protein YhjY with autotransporter beta-barrel domain